MWSLGSSEVRSITVVAIRRLPAEAANVLVDVLVNVLVNVLVSALRRV